MKFEKIVVVALLFTVACAPTIKTKRVSGEEGDELAMSITDEWVAKDTSSAVDAILKKMDAHKKFQREFANFEAKGKHPKLFVGEIRNNSSEAYFPIDDINNEFLEKLDESGDFVLIDNSARERILKEINYQNDGMVDPKQAKSIGKQSGADWMILGSIEMKAKILGGKTLKQYTLNIRITDIQTSNEVFRGSYKTEKYSEKSGKGW
ncbi:MAG: penicillin-binding protein activator LpoB [Rickettsiales bacterium]|jgi:PBP1b-binding outer membrane lipoprotein LpoB|nr:penicillin-binding protein activator LpoB [Rickettsiales bacterium]